MKFLKYNYNLDLFRRRNELFYYLLGVFITDGCITENGYAKSGFKLSLASADLDWLSIIRDIICPDMLISKQNNSRCYRFTVYSKEICEILIAAGCIPRKTLTAKLPSIPDKYFPDFIRGCMDGDGSIVMSRYTKTKPNGKSYEYIRCGCYLCGASTEFFSALAEQFQKLDFTFSNLIVDKPGDTKYMKNGYIVVAKNNTYRISFSDSSAAKFLAWAYYPDHILSMPRKRKIAEGIIELVAAKKKSNPQLYK